MTGARIEGPEAAKGGAAVASILAPTAYPLPFINKVGVLPFFSFASSHRLPPRDLKTSSIAAAAVVDLPVRTDSGRYIDLFLTRKRQRTSAAHPHP